MYFLKQVVYAKRKVVDGVPLYDHPEPPFPYCFLFFFFFLRDWCTGTLLQAAHAQVWGRVVPCNEGALH